MPKFLEDRLKAQAASKGLNEKQSMRYVFGAMNNLGAMHGNVETAKGARMDAKHSADMKAGKRARQEPTYDVDTRPSTSKPRTKSRAPSSSYPHSNLGKYLHPRKSK